MPDDGGSRGSHGAASPGDSWSRRGWSARSRLLGAGALAWAWPRLFPAPLEQARAAYERGDWPAAASLARETLKTKPGDRDGPSPARPIIRPDGP